MINYKWVLTSDHLKSMLYTVEEGHMTADEVFDHLCLHCTYSYIAHTDEGEAVELTEEQVYALDLAGKLSIDDEG